MLANPSESVNWLEKDLTLYVINCLIFGFLGVQVLLFRWQQTPHIITQLKSFHIGGYWKALCDDEFLCIRGNILRYIKM